MTIKDIAVPYLATLARKAAAQHLVYNLSAEYVLQLYDEQQRLCALSGVALELDDTASLDRIDSSQGYVPGNVRWVHKVVKRIRGIYSDGVFLEWCRKCFLHSYSQAPRPSVHEHFLMQAFIVALRSEDLHTKHGAIIVENGTNHPIGSGYNALFRGVAIEPFMLERPEKYAWMIHAEENAIMNCAKNPLSLPHGARVYITGLPCNGCLQRLINFGIKEIYVANRAGTLLQDVQSRERQEKILTLSGVQLVEMPVDNPWIKHVFLNTE